jgi:hypothetical protein
VKAPCGERQCRRPEVAGAAQVAISRLCGPVIPGCAGSSERAHDRRIRITARSRRWGLYPYSYPAPSTAAPSSTKSLISMARPKRFELLTPRFVSGALFHLSCLVCASARSVEYRVRVCRDSRTQQRICPARYAREFDSCSLDADRIPSAGSALWHCERANPRSGFFSR